MKPEGIDKLLKNKLDDHEITPNSDLWSGIEGALEHREGLVTHARHKIAVAVAVLLLMGGVLNNYYFSPLVDHEALILTSTDKHESIDLPSNEAILDNKIMSEVVPEPKRTIAWVNQLDASSTTIKQLALQGSSKDLILSKPMVPALNTDKKSPWNLELNISADELMAMAMAESKSSNTEDAKKDIRGIIKKTSNNLQGILNDRSKLAQIDFFPGISIERRKN